MVSNHRSATRRSSLEVVSHFPPIFYATTTAVRPKKVWTRRTTISHRSRGRPWNGVYFSVWEDFDAQLNLRCERNANGLGGSEDVKIQSSIPPTEKDILAILVVKSLTWLYVFFEKKLMIMFFWGFNNDFLNLVNTGPTPVAIRLPCPAPCTRIGPVTTLPGPWRDTRTAKVVLSHLSTSGPWDGFSRTPRGLRGPLTSSRGSLLSSLLVSLRHYNLHSAGPLVRKTYSS